MTDRSAELVTAVVEAMVAAGDSGYYCDEVLVEGDTEYFARVAAVGVLRYLAKADRTWKGGDAFLAGDFEDLADEVEGA